LGESRSRTWFSLGLGFLLVLLGCFALVRLGLLGNGMVSLKVLRKVDFSCKRHSAVGALEMIVQILVLILFLFLRISWALSPRLRSSL